MTSIFAKSGPWLFGRREDLLFFGGSALAAFALLAIGWATGVLDRDAPDWVFFACVVLVDVAHVWTTLFRVYLDGAETRRRPALFWGLPIALYGLSVLLHAAGPAVFWRVLAYVAVFHFVRQQAGWMRLYEGRDPHATRLDRALDRAAIYLSTVYPVVWWHGHLPRSFHWFLEGDFVVGLAAGVAEVLFPVYLLVLVSFFARQIVRAKRGQAQPGKALLVGTTAACWYVGIVVFDSDFAFTVTNVLIHGVPYFALTYRYGRKRAAEGAPLLKRLVGGSAALSALAFVGIVSVLALVEETFWDRYVWHEHSEVFGAGPELAGIALVFLVPLLSLPQLTHYALDGLVWRRRDNPTLASTPIKTD